MECVWPIQGAKGPIQGIEDVNVCGQFKEFKEIHGQGWTSPSSASQTPIARM